MTHDHPAIILVNTQLGENIGAAARAMANFGLSDLRLVAPKSGWPNERAYEMASTGSEVLDNAKLYATTQDAIADLQFVYATTARGRDMKKPVHLPQEACENLYAKQAEGLRVGLMFGPERTGLTNEDSVFADAFITIPTAPEASSLNIAQAVVVLAYQYNLNAPTARHVLLEASHLLVSDKTAHMAHGSGLARPADLATQLHFVGSINTDVIPAKAGLSETGLGKEIPAFAGMTKANVAITHDHPHQPHTTSPAASPVNPDKHSPLATRGEVQGFFDQLETGLDTVNFWNVEQKKPLMWQNLRNLFIRSQLSEQEVRTLRGMIRALMEGRRR